MTIEKLVIKGTKVQVVYTDGTSEKLNYEIVLKNSLRKGQELSGEEYTNLHYQNNLYEAKSSALKLLGRREHSKKEIRLKLFQKSFDEKIVDEVVTELAQKEYLNDFSFAHKFAEERVRKGDGVNKIKSELIKRGVERAIIDEIEHKYSDDDTVTGNALNLARQKLNYLKKKETDNRKLRQKIYSYLSNKGYKYDEIEPAIIKLGLKEE